MTDLSPVGRVALGTVHVELHNWIATNVRVVRCASTFNRINFKETAQSGYIELNFRIPEGFPQGELLERDWAIDGNNARKAVRPERGVPLTNVLRAQQVALVQWLGEMGYRVVFR